MLTSIAVENSCIKMVLVVMNNSRSDNDSTLVRIVAFVVVMLIAPDVNMIAIVAEEGLVTNYCTLTMAQI